MQKKQFQEAKNKQAPELEKQIKELKDRLWNLKNDLAAGKVKNVQEIKTAKKSIAQLLTIIHGK